MKRPSSRFQAALAAVLFSLASGSADGRNAWTTPHVLRFAIGVDPRTLSPLQATSSDELQTERLIFDVLVTYDEHGNAVPDLAERVPTPANGDIAADGRRITYHLRHGVRWHDGAPFTSADVRFTYEAIVDPKNTALYRDGFDRVARVATPDPYTIVFFLKEPYAPALDVLFADGAWSYGILPRHLLRGYKTLDDAAFFTAHPVGTGPFAVERWRRGDRIELRRNDRYFRGRPKLERIVIKIVPDPRTRLIMLQNHEIDWYPDIAPNLFVQAARLPGTRTLLNPQNRFLALNVNLTRAPLSERGVRAAIAFALDKAELARDYSFGTARAAVADLPPEVWAFPRALRAVPHDPARARALLRGRRFALQLAYVADDPVQAGLALGVQRQLRAVGIDLELRPFPRARYYAPESEGGLLRGARFDLAFSSWTSGGDPDDSVLFACRYAAPAGVNYARYCSRAMDRAQATALGTFDRRVRARAYARIEALLLADVPVISIWWPEGTHAYNDDLRGFAPGPVADVWNAFRWDI